MAPRTWLNPGEEIVVDVRPHWSFLGRPLVAVVVILAGAVAAVAEKVSGTLDSVLAVLVVISLLWLVLRYARWATTMMILTTERLVQRRGVLGRREREIPLNQIGEVDCRRRVRDRLMGRGDVVVTSVTRGREVFEGLAHPAGLVRDLQRQIERSRRFDGPGGFSMADELERLEDLRRRGALTQAEFEAQRARLRPQW